MNLDEFMDYADGSLHQDLQIFVKNGETLDEQRKRALLIASIASNMAVYAFNALEETSRGTIGMTEQLFDAKEMAQLHEELSDLTSSSMYEHMTNQSAMRKLYAALTDFMNHKLRS